MKVSYIVIAILVCTLGVGSAFGAIGYYTDIKIPPSNGKSHYEILEDLYGGTFTASGLDFVGSGGVNAYRAYDYDSETEFTLNMLTGDQTGIDQIWTDGIAFVTAEAKYSAMGHSQSFGWNEGGTGTGTYTELLTDVGTSGYMPVYGDFLWSYRLDPGEPSEEVWWSLQSENGVDAFDHIVTYKIEGADLYGETMWLMFMEDSPTAPANWDYNDFVVEVTVVPEPATVLMFGLGGLALLRKRKK